MHSHLTFLPRYTQNERRIPPAQQNNLLSIQGESKEPIDSQKIAISDNKKEEDIEAALSSIQPIDQNPAENANSPAKSSICHIDKNTLASILLWLSPVVNATNQTTQTIVGLSSTGKPFPQAIALGLFSFFNSLAISGRVSVENMEDTIKAIKNRQLPEDMIDKNMPAKKRKALMFLGLAIALYVASADGILSKFFAKEIPKDLNFADKINETGWEAFSIFLASATSISIAFGEGLETVAALQELFGSKGIEYHNDLSKWISRAIAGIGGVFGSGQDILANFIGMQSVFNIATTSWWLLPIGVSSFLNGLTDFSLNGRFNMKNINDIFTLLSIRYPNAKETIALVLAGGVGFAAAYITNSLVSRYFSTIKEMYGIDNNYYDYTATTFSYAAPGSDFITYTGAAYPAAYFLIDKISIPFVSMYNYCCGNNSNHEPASENDERKLLLPKETKTTAEIETPPAPVVNNETQHTISNNAPDKSEEEIVVVTDETTQTNAKTSSFYKDLEKHDGLFRKESEGPPTQREEKSGLSRKRLHSQLQ